MNRQKEKYVAFVDNDNTLATVALLFKKMKDVQDHLFSLINIQNSKYSYIDICRWKVLGYLGFIV